MIRESDSMNDITELTSYTNHEDDVEIISRSRSSQSQEQDQVIVIESIDEPNALALSNWFVNDVGVLPSLDRLYCSKLFEIGIGTVQRLAKKISKEPEILKTLGFKPDDAAEILDVLLKDGLIPKATSEALSVIPPSTPVGHSHHLHSIESGISQVESEYSREKSMSISEEPPHPPVSQFEQARRKVRRGENSEKFKELINEATSLGENLRTAIEGKMEIAVVGELHRLALFIENSFEKQRAMCRANLFDLIVLTIRELGGSINVCEKALLVIALLCRHSDENKASVSYEAAKALGTAGACECVAAVLFKYVEDPRIVEVALDAIRCLCCLESNQARFGATTCCETVGRCLSHQAFINQPELCSWICRALGHLTASLDENRELVGTVGACEHIIAVMQKYQHNLNLCIELCWAIRNAAPIYNNRARFANEHGPETIAAIYKFHYNSENFAIEACRALVSLVASDDDDIIPRIANSGVLYYIMKSYKRYNDSEFLARWVFNLVYYVSCEPRLIPRLLSVDILAVLSQTLDTHAGYEPLAEWGLRTVAKLTKLPGIIGKMRNAGLCEVTVSTVQRQAISPVACEHGALAIGELATDIDNHDRLSTAAASEAIIGALRRHDSNIGVVTNACYAIHFLGMTENINSWMGANGACEAVTNALSKHTATNIDITIAASRAVGSLAFHDEGNISRLSAADACNSIVCALKTYSSDASVAEYTCRAIFNLCYDGTNVKEFGKKSACGVVVAVFQSHGDNPAVISQACLAVHGLAVKIKVGKIHAGNTKKLVDRGALPQVVAAMKKFPIIAEVQQSAAMAITSLGRLEPNRNTLGSLGACELIIAGLNNHSGNGIVVGKLALAVEALSYGSDTHKVKFSEGRVVEMLLLALIKQEKNAEIVSEIMRALVVMISHEPSRLLIRSEPSCKQIVKVLRLHEKDPQAAKWGCTLIYSASTDDIARERFGSFKACETVVAVLQKLGEKDCDVAAWGCKALFALSVLAVNQAKFANTDSCQAVVRTLREFYEDMVVAEWACAAFVSIAALEGNRLRLGSGGGCQSLQSALSKHLESEVITRLACEAIYELAHEATNRQLFGNSSTCESLVNAFSTHSNSASVSQQICRAISQLARGTPANASKFGTAGICELIGEAQRMHNFNVSFAEWSCAAITSLSEGIYENQSAFGISGVCESLISLLKAHRSNEIAIAQACRAVRSIANDHAENTKKLSLGGIVGTTLSSLRVHAASFYVAENCGWILTKIPTPQFLPNYEAIESSEGPVTHKELYKSVPAWDVLASVLTTHYQKDLTCRWISSAIQVFAVRGQLSHAAVCDAMIMALSHNIDKEKMLYHVLMPIGELAYCHVENGNRLVRQRIIETIDNIFIKYAFAADPELVYGPCFRAVAGLINNNAAVQERIYANSALPKNILKALYADLESELVSKWGCAVIAALCYKHRLLQYKLGPSSHFMVDIVQVHKHNYDICLEVCKAISRLAHANITNRNRLGASGICDEIPKIIHNFGSAGALPTSPSASKGLGALGLTYSTSGSAKASVLITEQQSDEIIIWAVRAIADLSANNPNNQARLGLSGCCEALCGILRKALDSKPTTPEHSTIVANKIKYTCWAIGNMVQLGKGSNMIVDETNSGSKVGLKALRTTSTKKNTARFGHSGLPPMMKSVLTKYSDNTEVMIWCLRAVNNLAKSRTTKGQLLEIGILGPVKLLASGYGSMSDSIGSDQNTFSTIGAGGVKDGPKELRSWAALAISSLSNTSEITSTTASKSNDKSLFGGSPSAQSTYLPLSGLGLRSSSFSSLPSASGHGQP